MKVFCGFLVVLGLSIFTYTQIGLYSISPMNIMPEGRTLVVWRDHSEPFFNSAERLAIERTGHVTLLTRALAASEMPSVDRKIAILPYSAFIHGLSGGMR